MPVAPEAPVGPTGPVAPCKPDVPVAPTRLVFAPTHIPFAAITVFEPTVRPFLIMKLEFVAKVHISPLVYFYIYAGMYLFNQFNSVRESFFSYHPLPL